MAGGRFVTVRAGNIGLSEWPLGQIDMEMVDADVEEKMRKGELYELHTDEGGVTRVVVFMDGSRQGPATVP